MKFVLFSVLYFLVVANLQSANCEEEYELKKSLKNNWNAGI